LIAGRDHISRLRRYHWDHHKKTWVCGGFWKREKVAKGETLRLRCIRQGETGPH